MWMAASAQRMNYVQRTQAWKMAYAIVRRISAYGNNTWVVVGQSGTIKTSADGTTWTARTAVPDVERINDVAYGNGKYVLVGYKNASGVLMVPAK
jgi:photosystem II stability/assembly factor-like uncharacterized protein